MIAAVIAEMTSGSALASGIIRIAFGMVGFLVFLAVGGAFG